MQKFQQGVYLKGVDALSVSVIELNCTEVCGSPNVPHRAEQIRVQPRWIALSVTDRNRENHEYDY